MEQRLEQDLERRLVSGLLPGLVSSFVFLIGLRIAIGARLISVPYLQLLAESVGVTGALSLPFGVILQLGIGVGWGLLFKGLFERPTLFVGLVFSIWQTVLTMAFLEIVLMSALASSLSNLQASQLAMVSVTLWALHFVYVLTFLSIG